MLLPLVALLLQAPETPTVVSPPGDKPVRVWLDSDSPLRRGSAVRVYVATGEDGNLVVLHRRTDGRIDVLFPANPTDDAFVRLGTYEIRGRGDRAGLVVAEPDGTGSILAALSPDPLRFNEFVHEAAWNSDALVASWSGSDAEGTLSDIVQRMLGDGAFSYDLVTYTVAPPVYAQQDTAASEDTVGRDAIFPPCPGCTYIGQEFLVVGSGFGCDAFFDECLGMRRFERRESRCSVGAPCAERPMSAIAYTGRVTGARATVVVPDRAAGVGRGPRAAPAAPAAPPRTPVIAPRSRVPPGSASAPTTPVTPAAVPSVAGRATPLLPGRRAVRAAAPSIRATALTAPISHVRFTLVSAPLGEGATAGVPRGIARAVAMEPAGGGPEDGGGSWGRAGGGGAVGGGSEGGSVRGARAHAATPGARSAGTVRPGSARAAPSGGRLAYGPVPRTAGARAQASGPAVAPPAGGEPRGSAGRMGGAHGAGGGRR
ncbi:MAG TPA: DUF4384 domain-containing protein [Gemmatimonadales bacterium]|nr:DUF4384 domain-containing protein [Gemmatimonadales bacterium]